MVLTLQFRQGTLELHGIQQADAAPLPRDWVWDSRTDCFRAPAVAYAPTVLSLRREGIAYQDNARAYGELAVSLAVKRPARPFQDEALQAWRQAGGRGVVVLPTGAGKSHVALLALQAIQRDTLVVAPTLDLVWQWYELLRTSFRCDVGVIGGGEHIKKPITVTTYDSAYIHMQHLGNAFGLVVFDECHHLPSDAYGLAAKSCLAPYRLGLTATPERADGREAELASLIGPLAYRRDVSELKGDYLADYAVEQIFVELTPQEREAYDSARKIYRDFVMQQGIRMSSPQGFSEFIMRSSQSDQGRAALLAYQQQKHMAFAAPSKLTYVEHLLHKHRHDRVLLFTERNSSAYEMSQRFLVPVITHQTPVTERSEILQHFGSGTYNVIATSKVLNEGVDIPDANVGIVISGSGSVREHVQRLGRLLRKRGSKTAVLYELVAADTSEAFTSQRRREHVAYD